jgi:hypothetical protein
MTTKFYDAYSVFINSEELFNQMKGILLCQNCGRLWGYWEGYENDPASYSIDK